MAFSGPVNRPEPATSRVQAGDVVPMPTFPVTSTRASSAPATLNVMGEPALEFSEEMLALTELAVRPPAIVRLPVCVRVANTLTRFPVLAYCNHSKPPTP